MSAPHAGPYSAWRRLGEAADELPALPGRVATFCAIELRRIVHDPWEIVTRIIQPALWLLLFGETLTRLHAFPTPGGIPYLTYLAPGIIAQSAVFVAIFYGIMLVWDRDAGVLAKMLATPTPRTAIVAGKAFAAAVRGLVQAVVILVLAAILYVGILWDPVTLLAAAGFVVLGASFFACLSMVLAGLVRNRDRMVGIGQAISLPLFFASNALYPTSVMPPAIQYVSEGNPMSYEVDALRGLLVGTPSHLGLDLVVLLVSVVVMVVLASRLLMRLVR
jgi:ABC-2 type transport system permease protein